NYSGDAAFTGMGLGPDGRIWIGRSDHQLLAYDVFTGSTSYYPTSILPYTVLLGPDDGYVWFSDGGTTVAAMRRDVTDPALYSPGDLSPDAALGSLGAGVAAYPAFGVPGAYFTDPSKGKVYFVYAGYAKSFGNLGCSAGGNVAFDLGPTSQPLGIAIGP